MLRDRLEKITDHMFLLRGENGGRFPYSHSILILDEENVLIDTGCGIEILRKLKGEYDISYVINSHTHPDHSAGNWVFKGRPIFVPAEGFDTSGDVTALSERFAGKRLAQYWQRFVKETMGFMSCPPTHSYNEQDTFNFGKTTLQPIHTPGHTKDHYCLYEKRKGILLSFDYDLTSFPWYGHRESSLTSFRASIRKLQALHPKVVVSSHRGIIAQNIDAEFEEYYKILDKRGETILALLSTRQSIDQLVEHAPIYGKFPYAEPLLRYWEGQMIAKHLEELKNTGQVKTTGNTYIRTETE